MYFHPITNEKLEFANAEEFLHFLKCSNPLMLRSMKKQYEAKYPEFEIHGIGTSLKIRKKSK